MQLAYVVDLPFSGLQLLLQGLDLNLQLSNVSLCLIHIRAHQLVLFLQPFEVGHLLVELMNLLRLYLVLFFRLVKLYTQGVELVR